MEYTAVSWSWVITPLSSTLAPFWSISPGCTPLGIVVIWHLSSVEISWVSVDSCITMFISVRLPWAGTLIVASPVTLLNVSSCSNTSPSSTYPTLTVSEGGGFDSAIVVAGRLVLEDEHTY